ncbi:MAG: hypothetical protein FWG74_05260 [Planctomycetes bacterium]|nr:hypothetical protein [Planctomycetota bacterium]
MDTDAPASPPLLLLDAVAWQPDVDALGRELLLEPDSDDMAELAQLVAAAPDQPPGAACLRVDAHSPPDSDDLIYLGGVAFRSALLREQLEGQSEAYPYLATCGRPLYDWARRIADPFHRYWAEALLAQALQAAIEALNARFAESMFGGKVASMNPGSLKEWPISQQEPLFRLLAEPAKALGMGLTESWLIEPNKSVSGVWFANEHGYVNCLLCPRENCPNRRAPYDAPLARDNGRMGI